MKLSSFFCEGKIPLDIVLFRNNRNFLVDALKNWEIFLSVLIFEEEKVIS